MCVCGGGGGGGGGGVEGGGGGGGHFKCVVIVKISSRERGTCQKLHLALLLRAAVFRLKYFCR